jgi:hypothetical protein
VNEWQPIETAPEGEAVMTCIDAGKRGPLGERNHSSLVRKGRLWFFPDMSMYVYYAPTHWRPTQGKEGGQ